MLITDEKGRTVSGYDQTLIDEIMALETEAARRDGRTPTSSGMLFRDLRAHPDLAARREQAFDDAAARLRDSAPLLVTTGDWVRVNGYRFRVGSIDPEARIIETERYGAGGDLVSSAHCRGDGLIPDTGEAADPDDLHPPDSMRDGHERARYVLKAHKRALGDRAL